MTPWTEACQSSLYITIPRSFLKLMSIEAVRSSNHLILCCPLLLPSVFPSIMVFSNAIVLNFLSITTEADQWLLGRAVCRRDYRKCLRKLPVAMDVFTILIIGDGFVSVYICHTQEILHFKYMQLCRLVTQSCQTLLQPHGL